MTRQPKSCYATADLLTHISRKGTGETGAKCPAAHHTRAARAKRQKPHPADPLTQRLLTQAAAGKGEESFFSLSLSVFREVFFFLKGRREGGNGNETAFVSGKPGCFPASPVWKGMF